MTCVRNTTLTRSSTSSLIADTKNISNNGTAVVYRPVGDMLGICYTCTHRIITTYCPIKTHENPANQKAVNGHLQQRDAKEKDVGIATKLLEEKLGQKGEHVILGSAA